MKLFYRGYTILVDVDGYKLKIDDSYVTYKTLDQAIDAILIEEDIIWKVD